MDWPGRPGLTGPGPSVGPDGIQDNHVTLTDLSAGVGVNSVTVSSSSGLVWQSGLNPALNSNAEFIVNPNDSSKGDLYFNPRAGLTGQTLTVFVSYANGKTDQTQIVAGASNPSLKMPVPAPVTLNWNALSAFGNGAAGSAEEGNVRFMRVEDDIEKATATVEGLFNLLHKSFRS